MGTSKTDIDAIAQQSQSRPRRRFLLLAAGAVLLGGGAVVWLLQSSGVSAAQYTTAPVARTDLVVTVTASGTGTVEAYQNRDFGAALRAAND